MRKSRTAIKQCLRSEIDYLSYMESEKLFRLMVHKGYPEDFAKLVCSELRTDFTCRRMLGYIAANERLPLEIVTDEMLSRIALRWIMDALVEIAQNSTILFL